MVPRSGEFNSERRVYFSEEMVAKRKYGCIWKIQKGLVRTKRSFFSFVGRGSVKIHSEEVREGNEGGTGLFEACRLVKGKVVGGDASKCRATCIARGGRCYRKYQTKTTSQLIYNCKTPRNQTNS